MNLKLNVYLKQYGEESDVYPQSCITECQSSMRRNGPRAQSENSIQDNLDSIVSAAHHDSMSPVLVVQRDSTLLLVFVVHQMKEFRVLPITSDQY